MVATWCGLHPTLAHRGRATMSAGVPPIEVLAERQRMATLLAENWDRVAGMLDGLAGDTVLAGPSNVHGLGLIAQEDLEAGTLITLYPVHRILQSLGDGRGAAVLSDEVDEKYFRPPDNLDAEELAYRQVAYRQTYSHPNPTKPESFQLDANALKSDLAMWLGHRINDGATLSPSCTSDEEILGYYAASGERRNVCAVALCVPLLGFVTTKCVSKGDELFATYGHGYWLQADLPCSAQVEAALREPGKEVFLWQVATDQKYADQIASLDHFISQTTSRDVQQYTEQAAAAQQPPLAVGEDTPDAADLADGSTEETDVDGAASASAVGFGASARARPKIKPTGKKRRKR